jgi:Ser/Thr protein kinase RdoA (MazF antagonist)
VVLYVRFKQQCDARDFAPFLQGYRAHMALPEGELEVLDAVVRLRCAVQAFYFAWRIANSVSTGFDDLAGNQCGLDDARRAWEQLGV